VLSDEVITQQVPFYYCPTRRIAPQLSVNGDGRGSVPHRPGALADYAMAAGDGSRWRWYGGDGGVAVARWAKRYRNSQTLELEWWGPNLKLKDVTDGLSQTIFYGEKYVHLEHFGEFNGGDNSFYNGDSLQNYTRDGGPGRPLFSASKLRNLPGFENAWYHFGSEHDEVVYFALGDGSVHGLKPSINTVVLANLILIADGNVIDGKDF